MTTLLEKAKAHHPKCGSSTAPILPGELDLVLSFINGEISGAQLRAAYDKPNENPSPLYRAAIVLQRAVLSGQITISRMKP